MTQNSLHAAKNYASFGTRLIAFFVDTLILTIPAVLLGVATHGLGSIIIYFAYKTIWEASDAQATPGKRAMGIIVTDLQGRKLDPKSSLIRSVVTFLSSSCMFIGHFVALFTEKNQAVHDLMADSVVIIGETKAPLIESWLDTAHEIFGKSSPDKNSRA